MNASEWIGQAVEMQGFSGRRRQLAKLNGGAAAAVAEGGPPPFARASVCPPSAHDAVQDLDGKGSAGAAKSGSMGRGLGHGSRMEMQPNPMGAGRGAGTLSSDLEGGAGV